MRPLQVGTILVVGFITAVLVERTVLLASVWHYTKSMPNIPVVPVGLWPVLQLMIVPLATFWAAAHWQKSDRT